MLIKGVPVGMRGLFKGALQKNRVSQKLENSTTRSGKTSTVNLKGRFFVKYSLSPCFKTGKFEIYKTIFAVIKHAKK
jgi:hypothetical protein